VARNSKTVSARTLCLLMSRIGLLGKGKVGNTLILRNNLQGHWVEKVRMGGLALFCKLLAAFILCEGRCVKNFQMHVYDRI